MIISSPSGGSSSNNTSRPGTRQFLHPLPPISHCILIAVVFLLLLSAASCYMHAAAASDASGVSSSESFSYSGKFSSSSSIGGSGGTTHHHNQEQQPHISVSDIYNFMDLMYLVRERRPDVSETGQKMMGNVEFRESLGYDESLKEREEEFLALLGLDIDGENDGIYYYNHGEEQRKSGEDAHSGDVGSGETGADGSSSRNSHRHSLDENSTASSSDKQRRQLDSLYDILDGFFQHYPCVIWEYLRIPARRGASSPQKEDKTDGNAPSDGQSKFSKHTSGKPLFTPRNETLLIYATKLNHTLLLHTFLDILKDNAAICDSMGGKLVLSGDTLNSHQHTDSGGMESSSPQSGSHHYEGIHQATMEDDDSYLFSPHISQICETDSLDCIDTVFSAAHERSSMDAVEHSAAGGMRSGDGHSSRLASHYHSATAGHILSESHHLSRSRRALLDSMEKRFQSTNSEGMEESHSHTDGSNTAESSSASSFNERNNPKENTNTKQESSSHPQIQFKTYLHDLKKRQYVINACDTQKRNAMYYAVRYRSYDMIRMLIEAQANTLELCGKSVYSIIDPNDTEMLQFFQRVNRLSIANLVSSFMEIYWKRIKSIIIAIAFLLATFLLMPLLSMIWKVWNATSNHLILVGCAAVMILTFLYFSPNEASEGFIP